MVECVNSRLAVDVTVIVELITAIATKYSCNRFLFSGVYFHDYLVQRSVGPFGSKQFYDQGVFYYWISFTDIIQDRNGC